MRSRRLEEVRQLVEGQALRDWWTSLVQARVALLDAEGARAELSAQLNLLEYRADHHQRQAIETVYRGGEQGERGASLAAEAQRLDNQSYPALAEFEDTRFRTSEAWYRLGAAEANLEKARELGRPPDALEDLERRRRTLLNEYQRLDREKQSLWGEVERLWDHSAEVSLQRAEALVQASKLRRDAERGFGQALDKKKRATALRAELQRVDTDVGRAQATLTSVASRAAALFGCAMGTDFLYFRHPSDPRHAYAVAIVQDGDHYNLEVQPLGIYSVDLDRGVQFLEPARPEVIDLREVDLRFETFFLTGRRGQAQT
jgi:chromosome segregation ATPase